MRSQTKAILVVLSIGVLLAVILAVTARHPVKAPIVSDEVPPIVSDEVPAEGPPPAPRMPQRAIAESGFPAISEPAPAAPPPPTAADPLAHDTQGEIDLYRKLQEERIRRHETELRDSVWAPQTEAAITRSMRARVSEGGPAVTNVDCRHTTCVASIQWEPSTEHAPNPLKVITDLGVDVPCARHINIDDPAKGRGSIVVDCEEFKQMSASNGAGIPRNK